MIEDFDDLDAIDIADAIRKGDFTASEALEMAVARAEARNPALNAIVAPLFEQARKHAAVPLGEGRLAGVPFLVKDLLANIAGEPTSMGNRFWKTRPAARDSEMVRRFKAAGLNILGKTNTPEFGLTPYTESLTLGAARNPWDVSRSPGGSSGGSAAAVAARIVPMASGGDGGGSIRIPASACGLFGLKPTRARTPSGPDVGEGWNGYVVEHVLTRSVRDSALMLDLTQGADVGAPYWAPPPAESYFACVGAAAGRLKIAVSARPLMGKAVDAEVIAGFDETVQLLADLGHDVVEATPPIDRERFSIDFVTILAAELRADLEETAEAAGAPLRYQDFDPQSFGLGLFGSALSASDYARASRRLSLAARQVAGFFEGYDLLLTPTLAKPPIPIGSLLPTEAEKRLIRLVSAIKGGWLLKKMGLVKQLAETTFDFMPWTAVFNVTGQPAMSVPLCWSAGGLPIGMQFVGRFGDEATLFRLAGQLEQARPWAGRKPQMLAKGA
ncbi:amidase [Rhizobium sp. SG_E_25_P2]|uniref:amidase n=1 Tax=Rhizobium sp. SG_E_25_P2 TaxID=2879942 RepID=UPI002473F0C5|nr:amidase family protein [Rhizobium sp. SG_E_25_P2]MDH6264798.1 amidase [Rhizobium sp. SG_E_25_P2]